MRRRKVLLSNIAHLLVIKEESIKNAQHTQSQDQLGCLKFNVTDFKPSKEMKSLLFWEVIQQWLVISY